MALQFVIGAVLAAASTQASAQSRVQPSFSCSAKLSRVEAMICADEELSAFDAAVAIFYRHGPRKRSSFSINQAKWLKERNACEDRECILSSYQEWISQSADTSSIPWTHDRKKRALDGSDLMLGTLQSPTGKVKALGDSGSLFIQFLGHDWYVFSAFAVHFYDPHDGRGANESDSEASGVVQLPKGRGTWSDERCQVEFRRVSARAWYIADNESCSGLGSTLNGVYYSGR